MIAITMIIRHGYDDSDGDYHDHHRDHDPSIHFPPANSFRLSIGS